MSPAILSRMSGRERAGATVVGVVLLAVCADLLVVRPIQRKIAELDAKIRVEEKELSHNRRILASASRTAIIEAYRQHGERLRKSMSTAEENAAMLRAIEGLASRAGVGLVATRPQDTRMENDYEEYAVDIEVQTDMRGLMTFLHGVYASPQLLRVSRLELDRRDKSGPIKGAVQVTKLVTR